MITAGRTCGNPILIRIAAIEENKKIIRQAIKVSRGANETPNGRPRFKSMRGPCILGHLSASSLPPGCMIWGFEISWGVRIIELPRMRLVIRCLILRRMTAAAGAAPAARRLRLGRCLLSISREWRVIKAIIWHYRTTRYRRTTNAVERVATAMIRSGNDQDVIFAKQRLRW